MSRVNRRYSVFLLFFILISGYSLQIKAQIQCGDDVFSTDEVEAFNSLFSQSQAVQSKARAVASNYRVALRMNVVLGSGDTENVFSTSDAQQLIDNANAYFSKINVSFYILGGRPNYIYDDANVNLKIENEATFRAQYDVTNAINVYFFNTIVQKDLTILNGLASLPSLSTTSNRILYSYLDKNHENFATLRDKIFLHELGHYFGLFHTFQDSNNTDISKRELVTRGAGANCHTAGDYICDTNADPFERLKATSAYNCNYNDPTVVDANGETFTPPVSNLMSYYINCGNVFTPQQYQRMQAAFAIRFSPSAAYQIAEKATHFITVNDFNKSSYCEGENAEFSFSTEGNFNGGNQFSVLISDANGENFKPITASINNNTVRFIVPSGSQGTNFRVKVVSSSPSVESPISDDIEIKSVGTISLTTPMPLLRRGESSTLTLSMSGTGPWNILLSNGTELTNYRFPTFTVNVNPSVSTTYSVVRASGACGIIQVQNQTQISIIDPTIEISSTFKKDQCEAGYVQIPVTGLKNFSSANPYRVIITDAFNNRTELVPQVSLFSLLTYLPSTLATEQRYSIHIENTAGNEYSLPVEFYIRQRPSKPAVNSPLNYCFNAKASALSASGTSLKWYYGLNELTSYPEITPQTNQEGRFQYYVSQVSQFGCESPKNEISVTVKQPVTADISGNEVIKLGEKARLMITMTGDAPWKVELSDGSKFSTESPISEQFVQPEKTSTYRIVNVANQCGEGLAYGEAKITVLSPLANESFETAHAISVFPSPFSENFEVKIGAKTFDKATLRITTSNGVEVYQEKNIKALPNTTFKVDAHSFPTGILFVSLEDEKNKSVIKTLKIK